jgi:hypothetical protein
MMRGTREWLAYLAAVEQLKSVMAEAWLTAFRAFVERLAGEDRAARADGRPAPGWDRIEALWAVEMRETLNATYRGAAFLCASRDLLRAETDLRRGLRAQVEGVATALGLPTRAEIDDLSEAVDGLRRQMRRMRAADRARAQGRGAP